jgi:dTDP-4-amino-4,6-dideoxygalactose transaminase
MLNAEERTEILKHGRPDTTWEGEPKLGGIYDEDEIEAAVSIMRRAADIRQGFGFSGYPIPEFEQAFAEYTGAAHGVAVNSAGPGLDMAMKYLNLEPGDEVIVQAINFVAAPLAVMGAGGQVVWAEVDSKTLQLDPEDVEQRITPRTRAILPVHMNGLAAPMDELLEIARRHPHPVHGPLPVIGDAARATGAEYKGGKIGQHGSATVFSLHTMKNICTLGEGGMITTNDKQFADYCRSTRFYGFLTDSWGTSNVMTTVQAAVGLVQLKKLDAFVEARRRLALERHKLLEGVEELELPLEPADRKHTYYLYTVLVKKDWAGEKRDKIIEIMADKFNIKCIIANPPCYQARKVLREHTKGQTLPHSDEIGARLLCVPIHPAMLDEDNAYISAALIETVGMVKTL